MAVKGSRSCKPSAGIRAVTKGGFARPSRQIKKRDEGSEVAQRAQKVSHSGNEAESIPEYHIGRADSLAREE